MTEPLVTIPMSEYNALLNKKSFYDMVREILTKENTIEERLFVLNSMEYTVGDFNIGYYIVKLNAKPIPPSK